MNIMEKLMKPVEYAKELGISRQAVYAKIKRGILTAKSVEGKLYIVVDSKAQEAKSATEETKTVKMNSVKKVETKPAGVSKDYKALLEAKDETIEVLKGTVKDLKKTNKQISTTLKGEIDLLKEAFHEMRTIYIHQLEHKKPQDAIDVMAEEESVEVEEVSWISLKKFFKHYKVIKIKHQEKVLKRLKKVYKKGDERLTKIEGKLKLNRNKNYEDILK
jgi:predicted DNA-binding protein YlxM (UPF0122 family)